MRTIGFDSGTSTSYVKLEGLARHVRSVLGLSPTHSVPGVTLFESLRKYTTSTSDNKVHYSLDYAVEELPPGIEAETRLEQDHYTYDLGGNRLTLSLDGTLFVSYGWDDASRLASITKGTSVFGLGYDNANRRTSLTYPNGIATSYTYDTLNRLTNLAAVLNGTTSITNFTYVYDNAGNRTRKQQLDYTEDYGYDPLYRLTSVSRTGSTPPSQWAYGYDPVGNRTTEQVDNNLLTAVYDQRNELTARGNGGALALHVRGTLNEPGTVTVNSAPARMGAGNTFDADVTTASGPNTLSLVARDVSGNQTTANYSVTLSGTGATYTYDANGNLAQKVDSGITTTYTWDAQNRLVQVQNNGSTVATFAYDALGRRVQKAASGVTTSYLLDSGNILREVRSDGGVFRYVHPRRLDEPFAKENASGALTYAHVDGLDSVVNLTNQAGQVVHSFQYDAWGNIEAGASQAGYAFTSREWEPETGLYYFRSRFLDGRTGRFLSEDPIRSTWSLYAYVRNNPVNLIDPLGLKDFNCPGCGSGQVDQIRQGMAGICQAMLKTKCAGALARAGITACVAQMCVDRPPTFTCAERTTSSCGAQGGGRNQVILYANAFDSGGCGDNSAPVQGTIIHEISHVCIFGGQGKGPDCDSRKMTISGPMCSEAAIDATNRRSKDLEENCSGK